MKRTAQEKLLLKPGTLWQSVLDRTMHALECGALQSIPTDSEFVEQEGIQFLVRILSNVARKEAAKKQQLERSTASGHEFNPFLPYEEDLFVADVSDTHVCILNKFNVVQHHLLIITRSFEDQEALLTLADFEAMWACMTEFDGLAFYNGGEVAGASQRHKHLQVVPLPFATGGPRVPIESVLAYASFPGRVGVTPQLPFVHVWARLDSLRMGSPREAAEILLSNYHSMLKTVGLKREATAEVNRQSGPYNLLMTREWMLLLPRSEEFCESISINALGFAGALLVRDAQQMQVLKSRGPLRVLQQVAWSTHVSESADVTPWVGSGS